MKHTSKCTECPKSFTHPTKEKAAQALAMHVGRMHKGNIINTHEHKHTGVLREQNGSLVMTAPPVSSGRRGRSYLTGEQSDNIVGFIRTNQSQYPNKSACLVAALESVGAAGKIIVNSTAVNRYFKKAAAGAKTGKRPYVKRAQPQPLKAEVQINFCPCCGTDMQAIAAGMAMAAHLKKA